MISSILEFGSAFTLNGSNFTSSFVQASYLLWLTTAPVVDLILTTCSFIMLYHARANSDFRKTHDKLAKLIKLTVQTGFLTSALAVISLALSTSFGVYVLPWYVLDKSYVIWLLANLNARQSSNNDVEDRGVINQEHSIRFAAWQRGGQNVQHGNASIGISTLLRSLGSTMGSAANAATNGLGVGDADIHQGPAREGEVSAAEDGFSQDGNGNREQEQV